MGHLNEFVPSVATSLDDVVIGFPHAMAEKVGAQELPDVLDWVQFRRAGRQRQQHDIVWHAKPWRGMPASAVEHQDRDGSHRDALADLHEVLVHRLDIHLRHDDRRAGLALRADGSKQVGPFIASIAWSTRAGTTFRPDTGYRSLLSDPCLIGEPDFHRFAGRIGRQSGCYKGRKLALKTACSSGLLCGCCGRTEMCRNDNLCNSLPTVLSCSLTANSC